MTGHSIRIISWFERNRLIITLALGVGLVLAFAGAFGSHSAPLVERLAYWCPVMLFGCVIADVVITHILRIERWAGSTILSFVAITVPVAVVMAGAVTLWGSVIGWVPVTFDAFTGSLGPSLLITGMMTGIGLTLNQLPTVTHAPPATALDAAGQSARPAFLERLPPRLYGAEIVAVEAQDHYLKVHTSRGSEMILMRLSDAVRELEGVEGAQVHRSWWVARAAVETAQTSNGRATLSVAGGLTVPVSRTYARALREDGWFR